MSKVRIKCPGYELCKRWFTQRAAWRAHAACCCEAQLKAISRTDKNGKYTYSMDRLNADHERGCITIARRNVPMFKVNKFKEEMVSDDEEPPPPKCLPKEPPPPPPDPCQVAPPGLAAL